MRCSVLDEAGGGFQPFSFTFICGMYGLVLVRLWCRSQCFVLIL
jgi:hypothetical protein